jgi:hypothetical protein
LGVIRSAAVVLLLLGWFSTASIAGCFPPIGSSTPPASESTDVAPGFAHESTDMPGGHCCTDIHNGASHQAMQTGLLSSDSDSALAITAVAGPSTADILPHAVTLHHPTEAFPIRPLYLLYSRLLIPYYI